MAGTSEVVKAATAYFSQQPKPMKLKVSTRYPTDVAAQLRGGAVEDNEDNLALFTPVSDGAFGLTIDGVSDVVSGLDFTGDVTFAEIATTLQTGVQAIASGGFAAATTSDVPGQSAATPSRLL